MKRWQCTVCGYIHQGDAPPDKCPVCGADKSLFVPYEEASDDRPVAPQAAVSATKWRCTVCGYVHNGSEPPDKCPVCGADKSLFVPLTDEGQIVTGTGSPPPESEREEERSQSNTKRTGFMPPWEGNARLTVIAKMLTQVHGHPIAVHIPNGVLPVTVLFGLLALLFRSETFAIAARYNMLLVCLAMPIVIATGLIDWVNRFGGQMTPIFKNKMLCAGVVTVLTLLLSIWWFSAPDLYQRGLFANWFFVLLHIIDLGVAGLGGWLGGKLVFK